MCKYAIKGFAKLVITSLLYCENILQILVLLYTLQNMDQYSTKTTRLLHANHEMMMIVYGLLKYKRRINE
jgi:hypothetical protein